MNRHYQQSYKVRYDECNLFGFMTPVAAFRYFQDIAALDAAQVEVAEEGNWIARRTVIDFNRQVAAHQDIEIDTAQVGCTKVTAQRGYEISLPGAAGPDPAVVARTLWVFVNLRGRPTRLPGAYFTFWVPEGIGAPHEEEPWPVFPARAPFLTAIPVRFSDLDVMGHMNNTSYVELLDNAAWEAFAQLDLRPDNLACYPVPLHYDIEYLESAKAGDRLEVKSWFEPLANVPDGFERFQLVTRNGTTLLRSRSRWRWEPNPYAPENAPRPDMARLFNFE
ncbi:MAG TPA: thioesterase family protein [Chloroflexia bacterium]|nr:thioesterase family protein [Chloroflexia bacterium]